MAGFTIIATLLVIIFNVAAKPRGSIVPDRLDTTDDADKFPGKLIPISTLRPPFLEYRTRYYDYTPRRNRYPVGYGDYPESSVYSQSTYSPFDDRYLYSTYFSSTRLPYPRGSHVRGYPRDLGYGTISEKSHKDDRYSRGYDRRIMYRGGYSVGRGEYASRDYPRDTKYRRGSRNIRLPGTRFPSAPQIHHLKRGYDYSNDDQRSQAERRGMSSNRNDPHYYYRLLMSREKLPVYGHQQADYYGSRSTDYPVPSKKYPTYVKGEPKDYDDYPKDDFYRSPGYGGHSPAYRSSDMTNRASLGRRSSDLEKSPDYDYLRTYDYRNPSDDHYSPSSGSPYFRDYPKSNTRRRDYLHIRDDYPIDGYRGSPERYRPSDKLASSYTDEYYRGRNPFSKYSFIGIRDYRPLDDYTSPNSSKKYIRYPKYDDDIPYTDPLPSRGPYARRRLPGYERNTLPYPPSMDVNKYDPYPTDDGVSISLSNRNPSAGNADLQQFSYDPHSTYDHGPRKETYNPGPPMDSYQPFSSNPNSPFDYDNYRSPKDTYSSVGNGGIDPYQRSKDFVRSSVSPVQDTKNLELAQAALKDQLVAYDRLLEKYKSDSSDKNHGSYGADYYRQPTRTVDIAYAGPGSQSYSPIPNVAYESPPYRNPVPEKLAYAEPGPQSYGQMHKRGYETSPYRDPVPEKLAYAEPGPHSYGQMHKRGYETSPYRDPVPENLAYAEPHKTGYETSPYRDPVPENLAYAEPHKRGYERPYRDPIPENPAYAEPHKRGYDTLPYRNPVPEDLIGMGDPSGFGYPKVGGKSRDVEYVTVMDADVMTEPLPSQSRTDGIKYATTLDARPVSLSEPEPPSRSSACQSCS